MGGRDSGVDSVDGGESEMDGGKSEVDGGGEVRLYHDNDQQFPHSHNQHCTHTFDRQVGCASLAASDFSPCSGYIQIPVRNLALSDPVCFHSLFSAPGACFSPSIISPSGRASCIVISLIFPYNPVSYSSIPVIWISTRFSPP